METEMRSIAIAAVLAAGFALSGTAPTLSAPANSIVRDAAPAESLVQQVRCRRFYQCRHYVRYSRTRCGWWRRCW
jgi:hypothetical protein